MELVQEIAQAVSDLDNEKAESLVNDSLAEGVDAKLVLDGVMVGITQVGHRYETGEYYMLELMQAGVLGKKLIKEITPHLPKVEGVKPAKVVIGSTKGDNHDIGKNLIITQLQVSGYEVFDLGVDVPSITFVNKAKELEADIIGMSAFMSTTMSHFSEVINHLKDIGVRDQYKIIVGGGTTDTAFAESIGADGTATDAVEVVKLCHRLIAESEAVIA
ncbi:MAG: cobalamin-dependent protein [Actinobacteria bacterium]|nr:cobalamin-dependent protein [Actinomycetota bacterium]